MAKKKSAVEALRGQVEELVKEEEALTVEVGKLEAQLDAGDAVTLGELRVLAADVSVARDVRDAVSRKLEATRSALQEAQNAERDAKRDALHAEERVLFGVLCDAVDQLEAEYLVPLKAKQQEVKALGQFPYVANPVTNLRDLDKAVAKFQYHQKTPGK